jgi:hypothetical protein
LLSNVTLRYNRINEWRGSALSSIPLHSHTPTYRKD